jgi:hypothetical protein
VTPRQDARHAQEQITALWLSRPNEQRLYDDTLPFIEELELSHPDLIRRLHATNHYQTIMNAIRFLTTDSSSVINREPRR